LLYNDDDILRLQNSSDGSVRTIVVSPYLAQVNHLEKILKKLKTKKNIEIVTVDSFQGQEGDVVIVSTVRTKTAAQFLDEFRINVAVTRAMRILRIFGDFDFFARLATVSPLWRLADFAKRHKLIEDAKVDADWVSAVCILLGFVVVVVIVDRPSLTRAFPFIGSFYLTHFQLVW